MDRLAVINQLRKAGVECFTRTQWGTPREASYINRRITHPMRNPKAKYHYFHITVTSDTDTVQEGKNGARQIENYGYSTPPMVSYQDLVTNEGRYFQGQDYGTKGTHTLNDKNVAGFPNDLNQEGYACAILQNVNDEVTDVQVRTVAMVFAARELAGWVEKGAPVFPHRKFAAKSCPGDRAMARLDEIIRLKNKYVKEGLPGMPTTKPPVKNTSRGARIDRALKNVKLAQADLIKSHKGTANAVRSESLKAALENLSRTQRALESVPFIK